MHIVCYDMTSQPVSTALLQNTTYDSDVLICMDYSEVVYERIMANNLDPTAPILGYWYTMFRALPEVHRLTFDQIFTLVIKNLVQ